MKGSGRTYPSTVYEQDICLHMHGWYIPIGRWFRKGRYIFVCCDCGFNIVGKSVSVLVEKLKGKDDNVSRGII